MIQINLLRISPDSQYLEFSVECPTGYVFNQLYITRYLGDHLYDTTYDVSNLLVGTTTKEVMRIATDNFGTDITMYKVEFGVTSSVEGAEYIDNSIGLCSNINNVYANLLDMILKLNIGCVLPTEYEAMVRNYIFLYAHTEAMRLNRLQDAEKFYDLIWNLFVNCGPTTRLQRTTNKNCNCA